MHCFARRSVKLLAEILNDLIGSDVAIHCEAHSSVVMKTQCTGDIHCVEGDVCDTHRLQQARILGKAFKVEMRHTAHSRREPNVIINDDMFCNIRPSAKAI